MRAQGASGSGWAQGQGFSRKAQARVAFEALRPVTPPSRPSLLCPPRSFLPSRLLRQTWVLLWQLFGSRLGSRQTLGVDVKQWAEGAAGVRPWGGCGAPGLRLPL